MAGREQSPSPPESSGGLVLEWSRGARNRRIRLSPPALAGLAALGLAACVIAPCAAAYLAFRDDLLADLIDRQTQMQYAYEDRLAALRLQLDQVTSRQFIDQDGIEGKVQTLVIRQAQLETRSALVARLVEGVAARDMPASAPVSGALGRSPSGPAASALALPPNARAFVSPSAEPPAPFGPAKPQPEGMELRLGHDDVGAPDSPVPNKDERKGAPLDMSWAPQTVAPHRSPTYASVSAEPLEGRLERLSASLDRIEREQTTRVASLVKPTQDAAGRLRRAFDLAGLPIERYLRNADRRAEAFVGGPFVPAERKPGDALFERALSAAQNAAMTLQGLRRALPSVPLRKPLSGDSETTSTFGYRLDPFFGRPALHTGIDLRDDYGAPVRATAAGVVIAAGPNGGYGYMVEIDHGEGLTTRYAHLSAISATVGQQVSAGALIGRVGSTGRSTGPHLHYEVKMDGEPVDPARFLRAAATLADIRR